jgi:hypothetical protein
MTTVELVIEARSSRQRTTPLDDKILSAHASAFERTTRCRRETVADECGTQDTKPRS